MGQAVDNEIFSEILCVGDICRVQKLFSKHAEFHFLLILRIYIRIKVYYVELWIGLHLQYMKQISFQFPGNMTALTDPYVCVGRTAHDSVLMT